MKADAEGPGTFAATTEGGGFVAHAPFRVVRPDPRNGPDAEYAEHRAPVLAMLAKRFPRFDEDERLELYHEAWARVLRKRQRGERIESLRAYLMRTAALEAMNLATRGRPDTPIDPSSPAVTRVAAAGPSVEDAVVVADQARLCREVIDGLDARERAVFKLRWEAGLEPDEIRGALGLTRRQYKRLVKDGTAAIAERVAALDDGRWSLRQRSLVAACVAGIASEEQRAEAKRRVARDPHVAAIARDLRTGTRTAAAVAPVPIMAGAEADSAQAAESLIGRALASLRTHAIDMVAGTKQQALGFYVRAGDPTPLGGARPGAVAALVTGCVATTAAGLCGGDRNEQRRPDLPTPAASTSAHNEAPPASRRDPSDQVVLPAPPPPEPVADQAPVAPPPPVPAPLPPTNAPPAPRPAPQEFGFEL